MITIHMSGMRRAFFALSAIIGLTLVSAPPAAVFAAAPQQPMSAEDQLLGHLHSLKYVALGDSVAAGLGLPLAADASDEDVVCGRSPSAYSNEVAAGVDTTLNKFRLSLSTTSNACQGAVVANLTQPQIRDTATIAPQLDSAFAQGDPALLTITMGANDAHWADFIRSCFAASNCDTETNTTTANAYLADMQTKLSAVLDDIQTRSHFIPPLVVVTGYYNPLSAQCANPNLSTNEIAWLDSETTTLNSALRSATRQGHWFARFAPVDFTGHDICAADSWIQRPGVPGEPAPFHPTARGQQAMAQAVLMSLRWR